VGEGRLGAKLAGGFEEIERPDGVGIEIIEGDFGGEVVRGLRGGVDNDVGAESADEIEDGGAVAHVDGVVGVVLQGGFEALLVPGGVSVRTEELASLIVVDAVNGVTALVEGLADFGADESGGSGNENGRLRHDAGVLAPSERKR